MSVDNNVFYFVQHTATGGWVRFEAPSAENQKYAVYLKSFEDFRDKMGKFTNANPNRIKSNVKSQWVNYKNFYKTQSIGHRFWQAIVGIFPCVKNEKQTIKALYKEIMDWEAPQEKQEQKPVGGAQALRQKKEEEYRNDPVVKLWKGVCGIFKAKEKPVVASEPSPGLLGAAKQLEATTRNLNKGKKSSLEILL